MGEPCSCACNELYFKDKPQAVSCSDTPAKSHSDPTCAFVLPDTPHQEIIQSFPSLPCLTPNADATAACNPAPLRPTTAPPETYPNIPAQYLPHLFLIGSGQSGKIHLLTTTTVLKLPMEEHLADLENERDIYARLAVFQHPSILAFLGTLHTGIVLSYHPLGSLRIFIHGTADSGLGVTDAHVKVLARQRRKWAVQVAEGVQFLHQNGIVHCDTSSSNTLITSAHDVVLCDFSSSMMDGVAQGGKTRCSRWYKFISDDDCESFGEGRTYTVQDDLWAAGTVCYEMWTRRRLWGGFNEKERVRLYRDGAWPTLEAAGHMGNVIAKCWVDGYGCAGELLSDMAQIAESEETRVRNIFAKEAAAWQAVD
ncbi:hypothetical protein QTJ16_006372 [Diplocarpon rosae]|uniref:Protein kinase domain-containing protein n=1 Tax=Diplocarpon rosae TaxID=946125 RepID=A0AAD9WAJ8_9HELO|nr:hypothetical protein QTJ16_006372 [Diplocarpon rosae]PBP28187.1 serine/threonine protein kinase [Diplocarpon rosae]